MSLFHITTAAEWAQAQRHGALRPPSLVSEGFVHLSSAEQWPRTVKRFFAGRTGLVLLELDEARLQGEVRWEPADQELFPHLYAPLGLDAVVRATPFDG